MNESIAGRLLKRVFSCYFVVTVIVTVVQFGTDYRHAEQRLTQDIEAMNRTFTPGITDAMWGMSDDVLRGILTGMTQLPVVVGLKILDEHGNLVQAVGTIQDATGTTRTLDHNGHDLSAPVSVGLLDKLISRDFPVVYTSPRGDRRLIGSWTVYSDRRLIIRQVVDDFYIVLINSVIKTAALWAILFVVIGRTIGRPLRQLSAHVARLNIDNLGTESFELHDDGQHELHLLASALNRMTAKLRQSMMENMRLVHDLQDLNSNLQAKVAERTRDLEGLAATDLLTGLSNRRRLDQIVDQAARGPAGGAGLLSVILCDIDHFKTINDTYGHQVGDLVLIAFGERLRAAVRGSDIAGRWGGEEFLIVCPQTRLAAAVTLAERLRATIASLPFEVAGVRTASFGVAELRPGESPQAMIGRADAALYLAKNRGRNKVVAEPQPVEDAPINEVLAP